MDEIIDEVAIERILAGNGPARLTDAEFLLARELATEAGIGTGEFARRLGVTDTSVYRRLSKIRARERARTP